ncbi:hypothetical protein UFOVP328_327 [uncultured Caudovirales phage]|uniref:Uncharacterized protein n=1 Tax=uncultured Caudovirales phage TaxID=2100421 RepID=A0A6J5LU68_9CAUD|nr:hypothetical protein UFOVP328_327 [uncultured Caudovirales phage]
MKLICFPHYTAGGLLCDILNNLFSEQHSNGGLNNPYHSIGKIGDHATVMVDYDVDQLNKKIKQYVDTDVTIGTHCWPGQLDLDQFELTINITTATFRSRAYRWARAYHHYYVKSEPWTAVSGMDRIDKERETAKNYLQSFLPVNHARCHNLEFSEIVDNTAEFQTLMQEHDFLPHMDRWTKLNDFLYQDNFWNSAPVHRLHQAELEVNLNKYYVYG